MRMKMKANEESKNCSELRVKLAAKRKAAFAAVLCLLLCMGVMAGCGNSADSESYDLQQVYQDLLAAQPEGTDDLAGVMFETTDAAVIEEFYPGLGAIELKQEVCYQHAITGFCEIMLVEAANKDDVQAISDIFYQRIDVAADDSFYPETAQLWAQNAVVQTSGNYVAMAALPDGYTVPEKIFS